MQKRFAPRYAYPSDSLPFWVPEPSGDEWGDADVGINMHAAIGGNVEQAVSGVKEGSKGYKLTLAPNDYTGADAGKILMYRIVASNDYATKTIEAGRIYIRRVGIDATEDEQTLEKLYDILHAKLDNRKDIVSYTIGGRNVATMSLQEINDQIQMLRNRIETQRRGGRVRRHRVW